MGSNDDMKTVCIIQARMNSTRLPSKIMMALIDNKSMLECIIERVRCAKLVDDIVVATTIDSSDDSTEKLCKDLSIKCYRGSCNDVLARYYYTAKVFNADYIVRVTADCPVIDYQIIDEIVSIIKNQDFDYVSNTITPTFADGLDVEVFTRLALEKSFAQASLSSEREHVTQYIKKHPEQFKQYSFEQETDCSNLRWTVDEAIDLELIRKFYKCLYQRNNRFLAKDILTLLNDNVGFKLINAHIQRDEGLKKSMKNDEEVIHE